MSSVASLMKPVGPKAEAFVWDKRLITGIMGPVGSAKTTTCIRKSIHAALWQNPGPDGIYRAKGGVIRDTYPQLKKTALASWFQWFPKTLGDWNGEAPYEHTVRFRVLAGPPFIQGPARFVSVELSMIFAAIGEHKVEDIMRGWELTFLWLNEGDLVARDVFTIGIGRIGRFPSANQGGCKWRGVFIDMNAPDVENWTYELLVDQDLGLDDATMEELKEELGELFGIGFHIQPGGRSKEPPPENIENLPKGYYAQQIMGMGRDKHKVRRMVDNEFGPVRHGQPVYTEYEDSLHVAKEKLRPIKDVPLRIAADAGLTPAAVISQRDHRGQIRILGEVVTFGGEEETLEQLGATAFGRMVGRYVKDEFPDNPVAEIVWCDPAGTQGEGAKKADPSWRQNFQKGLREELGEHIKVRPAPVPGNRLEFRLEHVRKPMRTIVEGGEPAFIICPVRCKILRRGFKGMYIYARSKLANGMGRFNNEPVKNDYSHVQDACQYVCCGLTRQGNGDDAETGGHRHPGTTRDRELGRRREVKVEGTSDHFSGR